MSRLLKKIKTGSPILTNAACNRAAAEKAYDAGVPIERIAEFWSEVFELKMEMGREVLSQTYDYKLDDGSGRYETNRRITNESIKECIRRYTHKR